jgi:hypothetical protein
LSESIHLALIMLPISHTNPRMGQAIKRNFILIIGIALAAFLCLQAVPYLITSRGYFGPTILQAQSPVAAMIATLICFGLSVAVAATVGKLINAVVGMFVLGAGLFFLDGRLNTIRAVAFASDGTAAWLPLIWLTVEALLWAGLVLSAAVIVFKVAGPLRDIEPDEFNQRPHPLWSVDALRCAAAGAAMLAAVLLVGQSTMKGQMIAATVIGGIVAGLAGRLLSPHVQPILIFASPLIFAACGYVLSIFTLKSPLDAAYVGNHLPSWTSSTPLDCVVGTLMGVAMGVGWARSFLQHEDQPLAQPHGS